MTSSISTILVNYNNNKDTLDCLSSLKVAETTLFVVVNSSEPADVAVLAAFSTQTSGSTFLEEQQFLLAEGPWGKGPHFVVTGNHGFAAANNLVLKKFQHSKDFEYFWILNNDTIVMSETLSELKRHYQKSGHAGLLGVKTLNFDGKTLQSCGARYSKIFGMGQNNLNPGDRFDFVTGSSIFLDHKTLRTIGPMDESYFLYNEDIDWSIRCVRAGLPLSVCLTTHIIHKEGGTIGTAKSHDARSDTSDYYSLRSRIMLVKKHHKILLPIALIAMVIPLVNRLLHGKWKRALRVFRAIREAVGND